MNHEYAKEGGASGKGSRSKALTQVGPHLFGRETQEKTKQIHHQGQRRMYRIQHNRCTRTEYKNQGSTLGQMSHMMPRNLKNL